ncbi:murein L,D-transpeptidase family protein [Uliginosibacterium sp. sgz301328]|uniref:L,D-transpeptidase family protein n=1 Tax=Uliginosibacterium sp. sgz301328 TaxID=3243764 RepID=UPI00359E0668
MSNTMKLPTVLLLIVFAQTSFAGDVSIVVRKQARVVQVLDDGKVVKTYRAALGYAPDGTKLRQGDGKTPEGRYFVRVKNANSQFHLSLGIDYPGVDDAARGLKARLIDGAQYAAIVAAHRRNRLPPQNTALGGDIFLHGGGNSRDWTLGCIALDNADIEELYKTVKLGTPVDIVR